MKDNVDLDVAADAANERLNTWSYSAFCVHFVRSLWRATIPHPAVIDLRVLTRRTNRPFVGL